MKTLLACIIIILTLSMLAFIASLFLAALPLVDSTWHEVLNESITTLNGGIS